jgi:hypothetical protein
MEIETYERMGSCEFTAVQSLDDIEVRELRNGSAAVIGPNQNYFYVSTDDGLLTFSRDTTTGELQLLGTASTSDRADGYSYEWDYSSLMVSGTGKHLFVMGERAPFIAAYDIETDPEKPTLVSSIAEFYVDNREFDFYSFETRERLPFNAIRCTTLFSPTDSDQLHILCDDAIFSVTLQEEQLTIEDMLLVGEEDRFGEELKNVAIKRTGLTQAATNVDNTRLYLVVHDLFNYQDFMLFLESAAQINSDPY